MTDFANRILPLALYPLIATQGLYVKWRAAQLSEATGPRQGTTGTGPKLRLLVLGDSSAAGVGVANQSDGLLGQTVAALATDHTVDWQLLARCGDTTRQALARLQALPDQHFDAVVTALGVNDAKNGHSLRSWQHRTDALHDTLTTRFGAQVIVASGLPPVQDFPLLPNPLRGVLAQRCQQFDAALRHICDQRPAVRYLPGDIPLVPDRMAADGFHPTAPVYAEWGKRAADHIMQAQTPTTGSPKHRSPAPDQR